MKVRPIVAWYDLWIGAYWDRTHRRLYLLPLPCLGVVIQFAAVFRQHEDTKAALEAERALADRLFEALRYAGKRLPGAGDDEIRAALAAYRATRGAP